MIPYLKITSLCVGCDTCRALCPEGAILKTQDHYTIENWACTLCFLCTEVCPVNAIKEDTQIKGE